MTNVLVLCTGRCGSLTFAKACEHATNYTAAHESRTSLLGDLRLDYPQNHIEVDNRLCWFLGRVEKKYGDDAVYVQLKRESLLVAKSYNKRWHSHQNIARAYAQGILMSRLLGLEPCIDYVKTVTENIELFLANKTRVHSINISRPEEGFRKLWADIGAQGDLEAAIREFDRRHNTSIEQHEEEIPRPEFRSENDKVIYEMQRVLRMLESEALKSAEAIAKLQGEVAQTKHELEISINETLETRSMLKATQNSLANQLGRTIIANHRSPIGWAKMPFELIRAGMRYGQKRRVSNRP